MYNIHDIIVPTSTCPDGIPKSLNAYKFWSSLKYGLFTNSKPRYDFNKCKFHVHLTVPFSEFYESFLKLYKSNHFKNRIMSPVYEYLFEKYQIDIAFMIDYYVWKALKRENILFDSNYKIDIYSSDGKEINPIDKVFPK